MSKKAFKKRIWVLALSLIMVFELIPMVTLASSTSVAGAEGHVLDNIYTGTFTDGYDSTIFIYATPGACELPYTMYSLNSSGGNFGVPKYDSNQWYFAGWRTWYKGSHSGAGVVNSDKSNPEYNDKYNYFNPNADNGALLGSYPQGYMTVLKEYFWDGTYYLSAIFEPLVTVNVVEGVTYSVSGASKRAGNKYSTKYNNGMTINVDNSHVVADVSANYGTNYSKSGSSVTVNSIIKPTTINVNTRLKQHKVHFNANGGNGTMDTQVFEYGVKQELTPNSFTRDGYEFVGWLTTADDSGDYHYDKEMLKFTPENDGESSTLYAIWRPKRYTVTYKADGEHISSEMVNHGMDATLPAVPAKDGHIGKWDSDGKNIMGDTTISAIYTAIPVVKPNEVKLEDKADLENAKTKLEEELKDDSYTEGDKKDIQDAINDIDNALAELNKPTDTDKPADSPNTSDNSNHWMWFKLLFVSGAGIFAITLIDRKRKVENK